VIKIFLTFKMIWIRKLAIKILQLGLFTIIFVCVSCQDKGRPLPNIIIIFTDDQGYGDVGSYGAVQFTTPHLDQMAADGMRFTHFYAAQAVCSASRAALLTGCYPNRIGITGALFPNSKIGLHSGEETIAEMLKKKGYATPSLANGTWAI